ncbi:MAG: c-type cytochrome [Myxococcales bacterium]|nr:c-type cytochrome [Myxococcales bacterium]HRC55580.1 c-type cytochrome [Kofleriaceae bacterium]
MRLPSSSLRPRPRALRRALPVALGAATLLTLTWRAVLAQDPAAMPAAPARAPVTGRVYFAGKIVAPAPITPHHDPEVCAKGGPLVDESLLAADDGGLANVVVVLQGVASEQLPEAGTATLDQRACRFVPHVRTVTMGTTLQISSSDPVLHNVHAFLGKRTTFNLAIPVPGKLVERKLTEPGILRIRCDSGHTWMSAYIAVVPHRYHAVTGADGSFSIPDVPPGEYRVRAWHEKLGAVEQKVTVASGEAPAVRLTFKEPSAEDPASRPADTQLRDALTAARTAIEELEAQRRGDERSRLAREGAPLFQRYCATCHGRSGDGRGPSVRFTSTPPRDFTRGTYKFRMTPAGSPPSLDDLVRTISVGVRGTHMPAWKGKLTRTQIETLARYLTTLSDAFWSDAAPPTPLDIPAEPPYDGASVARGKALYGKMQCATCHGDDGHGDGPAAKVLRDDWSNRISPANFARGELKGGCCGAVIYRAISTGLGGTPMPSFAGAMSPAERWDLAHYVLSLGHKRPAIEYLLRDPAGRISSP